MTYTPETRLEIPSYTFEVPAARPGEATIDVGDLPPQPYGTTAAGQTVPDFVFPTLDGDLHTLSQFRGKVVLLDFWGTWCGVCARDLPQLKAIYEEHGGDPRFVMISLSVHDEKAKLEAHVQANGMNWTHGILGDPAGAWPVKLCQVQGYPSYWLIDPDGRVIFQDWRIRGLKSWVDKALAAKVSP